MSKQKKNKSKSSRKIEDLPDTDSVDPTVESQNMQILSDIMNIKEDNPTEYSKVKFVTFATAIFALLSLPFSDRLIELSTPIANSWLILWGIKIVIFFILYYIVFYSTSSQK